MDLSKIKITTTDKETIFKFLREHDFLKTMLDSKSYIVHDICFLSTYITTKDSEDRVVLKVYAFKLDGENELSEIEEKFTNDASEYFINVSAEFMRNERSDLFT